MTNFMKRWNGLVEAHAVETCIGIGKRRGKRQLLIRTGSHIIGWVYSPGPDKVAFWFARLSYKPFIY